MAFAGTKVVTTDPSKCGSADSTDFAVLVAGTYSYLKTVANGGSVTSSSGHDICFFADAGLTTLLDWELVEYDPTTGKIEAHVRVGTLSASVGTVFYLGHGDSGITTFQGDVAGTWNSGFALVAHLPNGTTLSANDSTANANHGTITNAVAAAGKIGGGASFDGAGDSINFGSGTSVDTLSTITVEAWIKRGSVSTTTDQHIASKEWNDGSGFGGWWFYIRRDSDGSNGGKLKFGRGWSGSTYETALWRATTKLNSTAVWYHCVVTYDAGSTSNDPIIYLNGVSETLVEEQTPSGTLKSDNPYNVRIGEGSYGENDLNGVQDEFRVSNVIRSADWVLATYNNQNDPSTFYAITNASTVVEADGASAGVATPLMVSGATAGSVGSVAGVATPAVVGAGIVAASCAISGSATPSAISGNVAGGVLSAAGVAVVTEVGAAVAAGVEAAAGVAAVTGVSGATIGAVGAAAGVATPALAAAAIWDAILAAAGAATVTPIGSALVSASETASGVAMVTGSAAAVAASVLNGAGVAAGAFEGTDAASSGGDVVAAGVAVVTLVSGADAKAVLAASGVASVSPISAALALASTAITGSGAATAVGAARVTGVIVAAGVTTVTPVSGAIAKTAFGITGSSSVDCEGTDAASSGADFNSFGEAVVTGVSAHYVSAEVTITAGATADQRGAGVGTTATAITGAALASLNAALAMAATGACAGGATASPVGVALWAGRFTTAGAGEFLAYYVDPTTAFYAANGRALFRKVSGRGDLTPVESRAIFEKPFGRGGLT